MATGGNDEDRVEGDGRATRLTLPSTPLFAAAFKPRDAALHVPEGLGPLERQLECAADAPTDPGAHQIRAHPSHTQVGEAEGTVLPQKGTKLARGCARGIADVGHACTGTAGSGEGTEHWWGRNGELWRKRMLTSEQFIGDWGKLQRGCL